MCPDLHVSGTKIHIGVSSSDGRDNKVVVMMILEFFEKWRK